MQPRHHSLKQFIRNSNLDKYHDTIYEVEPQISKIIDPIQIAKISKFTENSKFSSPQNSANFTDRFFATCLHQKSQDNWRNLSSKFSNNSANIEFKISQKNLETRTKHKSNTDSKNFTLLDTFNFNSNFNCEIESCRHTTGYTENPSCLRQISNNSISYELEYKASYITKAINSVPADFPQDNLIEPFANKTQQEQYQRHHKNQLKFTGGL